MVDADPCVESSCRNWNPIVPSVWRILHRTAWTVHDAAVGTAVDASGGPSEQAGIDGVRSAWSPFIQRGAQVTVLCDTPAPAIAGFTCLQENLSAPSLCDFPLAGSLADGFSQPAATGLDGALAVDVTDYFFPETICRAAIGAVFVYRAPSNQRSGGPPRVR